MDQSFIHNSATFSDGFFLSPFCLQMAWVWDFFAVLLPLDSWWFFSLLSERSSIIPVCKNGRGLLHRKPYRVANTSSLDTHKVPTYYRHWAKKDLLFSNGLTWQKLDCSMNYILWWKVARTIFLIISFQCLLMWHILLPRLCTYIICDVLFSEAKVKWPVLSHL